MIVLKIKNRDELKAKSKEGKNNKLAVCSVCPSMNFSKDEVDALGRELNAEVVGVPAICRRPEINMSGDGVVFVLACGAGVQVVGEALKRNVVPAADTMGIGAKNKEGGISNYCVSCGDCIVDETADICPKARCEKSLLNGPCAGVHEGLCELGTKDNPIKCGWNEICVRMVASNEVDKFMETRMPKIKR